MNTSINSLTEREYRNLERESYSSLASFVNDRKSYHKRYILKEYNKEEKISSALIYGSLLDTLLLSPDLLEERFVIGSFEYPTPQMKSYTENVVKHLLSTPDADKEDIYRWAYSDTKYDETGVEVAFKQKSMTVEAVIDKFIKECKYYYEYLLKTIVESKHLITLDMYNKAVIGVDKLLYNKYTGPILSKDLSDFEFNRYTQLIILFRLKGVEFKSMLDLVDVDHSNMTIQPYDIKTSSNAETFSESYLKFKYYIQAGVYHLALIQWAKDNKLDNFTILPMKFIVIDSSNYMSPLIYTTTKQDLTNSIYGFSIGKKIYKGINTIIDELVWHKDKDIWDISKANYDTNGVVQLIYNHEERESTGEEEDQN